MTGRYKVITGYLAFWFFLVFFKFGAGLQYTLLSPLGARVLPLWVVGAVIFVSSIFQMFLDVPVGFLLDKYRYKKMLMVGTAITFLGVVAFLYGITTISLLASIFLVAVGWTFYTPGTNAYLLSHAKKSTSVKFFAYHDVFASLGIAVGVMVVPFIVNATGYVISLWLSVAIILALIAIYLAPKDIKKITMNTSPHRRTHHQRRYVLTNIYAAIKRLTPASTLLLLLNCAAGIFYGIVWFIVPLIIAMAVYNGALLSAGLASLDFAVVIIASFLSGKSKKSLKKMIFTGLLVFSLSGFLLGMSFGILFIIFAVLSTIGEEMASLPLWAWLHELDETHNQDGLMSGLISLSADVGWAIGPLSAGILYQWVGPSLAIELGAIPIAAVLLVYYFATRTRVITLSLFTVPPKPHYPRHKS